MNPNRRQIILTFVAACALGALSAACASGGGEGRPRMDPNLITAEEIADHPSLTCLEVVQRLRPRWLQRRGSEQNPVVYQDGNRVGSAEDVLSRMNSTAVEYMRYVNARDATTRYGTGHGSGAIEVATRRR